MTKSRGIQAPRTPWTEPELEILRDLYPDLPAGDIAALLDRSLSVVYDRANRMGLKKSAEFLASDLSGRVARGRQLPSMVASQFKKGQISWNKGLHYMPGGRGAETRFKKGRAPQESRNYVPIGSLRISADGYPERKVSDDQSLYPARRWVAVHRLVWVEAHGEIPDGHIVVFKPGCKTTEIERITPEILECITRGEHARRNHPRSRSPELGRLVQLKGAITRQVNRIVRQAEEQTA